MGPSRLGPCVTALVTAQEAGPNCRHIGLLIEPAKQMHPGPLLLPTYIRTKFHVYESAEACRTLAARASEKSLLSGGASSSPEEAL